MIAFLGGDKMPCCLLGWFTRQRLTCGDGVKPGKARVRLHGLDLVWVRHQHEVHRNRPQVDADWLTEPDCATPAQLQMSGACCI